MMLHILGILSDHIATSQLDTIKTIVTGDYMISKNLRIYMDYVEIDSKRATFYISSTHSQYFRFSW